MYYIFAIMMICIAYLVYITPLTQEQVCHVKAVRSHVCMMGKTVSNCSNTICLDDYKIYVESN